MRPVKVKPTKKITLKKNRKKVNIQGKYKVIMLRGSQKKKIVIIK